jgi:hypothetical protein
MAILALRLMKNAASPYGMMLAAGKSGLNRLIQWAHIVEDEDVLIGLHGGEMVFTTGIKNRGDDWLLNFAKKLAAAGVSAFAVCLGPRIPELPPALAEFCDSAGLPFLTVPPKTRVADMIRDYATASCWASTRRNHRLRDQEHPFQGGRREAQALKHERWRLPSGQPLHVHPPSARTARAGRSRNSPASRRPPPRRLHELFVSFSATKAASWR